MAPKGKGPFLSYITGWLNLLGNSGKFKIIVAADAFFAYTFVMFAEYMLLLMDYPALSVNTKVIAGLTSMMVWGLCNLLRIDHQSKIHTFASILQIICTVAVIVSLYVKCSAGHSASLSEITTSTYNDTGIESPIYLLMIGCLSSCYCFLGYDAAGHLGEETHDASRAVPRCIVATCALTAIVGGLLVFGYLFGSAYAPKSFANAELGVSSIFLKCMGTGPSIYLTGLLALNSFFSGMSSLTVTVRMAYSFARDGGLPFSNFLQKVHETSGCPVGSTIACTVIAAFPLLLQLFSDIAFLATISISAIGFQVSYAIPIVLRITTFRHRFKNPVFNLGSLGTACGTISAGYLIITSILFMMPVQYPMEISNFNFTPLLFAIVMACCITHWFGAAQKSFVGPVTIKF